MINKSITIDYPFLLAPVGKDYLWGGDKLKKEFNKGYISCYPLAETWECSTHVDGISTRRTGVYSGKGFDVFLKDNPNLLCNPKHQLVFPVLLKLIDAKEKLSLQVHPSDEYAYKYEFGQKGKLEFWYILDAEPGSYIYYGFKSSCNRSNIRKLIENGELESVLNKVLVEKGDSFFIHPGMVHAIGKGIVLAEIQENSNLTYRLYDYNRKDKNGKLRDLHIEQALNVIDFSCTDRAIRRIKNIKYESGIRKERLLHCEYFIADVWGFEKVGSLPISNLMNYIVICIEGEGVVNDIKNHSVFKLKKGDCFFMPRSEKKFKLVGKCEIIVVGI